MHHHKTSAQKLNRFSARVATKQLLDGSPSEPLEDKATNLISSLPDNLQALGLLAVARLFWKRDGRVEGNVMTVVEGHPPGYDL